MGAKRLRELGDTRMRSRWYQQRYGFSGPLSNVRPRPTPVERFEMRNHRSSGTRRLSLVEEAERRELQATSDSFTGSSG
jgi:hypothetical protein